MLWVCGAITIAILLVIVGYVLWNGMGVISLDFLTKILPAWARPAAFTR